LRIAVLPYTTGGGLSTYALELSEALVERGLDVTLLGVEKVICSKALRYETIPHIEELNVVREPFLWNASIGASASRILQSSAVDIVHCVYPSLVPFIYPGEVIVSNGWFSPHDLWARLSIAIRMAPFSLSRLPELYGQAEYFLLDELGYGRSARVLAVTKILEEGLRKKFGARVRYLPPGIKLSSYSRRKYSEDEKVIIACIAADLENPRKGVSSLLRALMLIEPALLKKVEIWLIGSYSDKLVHEVQILRQRGCKSLKLLGYVPREKILELLLKIDILICPSLYEEFGYVILEAMSAGVPIVATKINPLIDIVVHGVSGFLYVKENPRELSHYVSLLISDDSMRHKMGEEAWRRISEHFSWNSITQRIENYYKEALNNPKPISMEGLL